jgi:hypothetical protein
MPRNVVVFALLSLFVTGVANADHGGRGGGHPRNDLPLNAKETPQPARLFVLRDGKWVRNPDRENPRSDDVKGGTNLAAQSRWLP